MNRDKKTEDSRSDISSLNSHSLEDADVSIWLNASMSSPNPSESKTQSLSTIRYEKIQEEIAGLRAQETDSSARRCQVCLDLPIHQEKVENEAAEQSSSAQR
jgi:hypothetical protein